MINGEVITLKIAFNVVILNRYQMQAQFSLFSIIDLLLLNKFWVGSIQTGVNLQKANYYLS